MLPTTTCDASEPTQRPSATIFKSQITGISSSTVRTTVLDDIYLYDWTRRVITALPRVLSTSANTRQSYTSSKTRPIRLIPSATHSSRFTLLILAAWRLPSTRYPYLPCARSSSLSYNGYLFFHVMGTLGTLLDSPTYFRTRRWVVLISANRGSLLTWGSFVVGWRSRLVIRLGGVSGCSWSEPRVS